MVGFAIACVIARSGAPRITEAVSIIMEWVQQILLEQYWGGGGSCGYSMKDGGGEREVKEIIPKLWF